MNYTSSDFYFSPQFVEEFGLPNSLQLNVTPLVDWVENPDDAYINAPLEEISPTYVLGNEGLPSNPDPSGLSMGSSGQLYFPGTVSHEPRDNNFSSCPCPNPLYVEPAQYNHAPHAVPLDSHSTQHFNTSQTEYLNQYRTDWELKMHLFSNSQKQSPENHIGTETLNDNVSPYDVRQSYQEPGSAFDYKFNRRESYVYPLQHEVQGVEPVTHDSQPLENIYPKAAATTIATTATNNIPSSPYSFNINISDSHDSSLSSSPSYIPSCQSIPRYQDPLPSTSFFTSLSYPFTLTDTTIPPVALAPCSYPSQHNNLPQGAQFGQFQSPITIPPSLYSMPEIVPTTSTVTIPTTSHPSNPIQSRSHDPSPSSSFSSPPYPITPIDSTAAPITLSWNPAFPLAHQISKRTRTPLPSQKLVRTPKKVSSVFVPAIRKRQEQKPKRELSNKRAPIRSQEWLDKYFPNRGSCILCKEDKARFKGKCENEESEDEAKGEENVSAWRSDRALEHLVSSHIIQVIKNMERPGGVPSRASAHLLETEAQLAFAREQIEKMRCSLCTTVSTSLVFRKANVTDHLRKVHAELPESVLQKELERLGDLMPDRTEWYSYQDKFLYYFPRK